MCLGFFFSLSLNATETPWLHFQFSCQPPTCCTQLIPYSHLRVLSSDRGREEQTDPEIHETLKQDSTQWKSDWSSKRTPSSEDGRSCAPAPVSREAGSFASHQRTAMQKLWALNTYQHARLQNQELYQCSSNLHGSPQVNLSLRLPGTPL